MKMYKIYGRSVQMRHKIIIAFVLSAALFTGCYGGREVSDRAFAQLIGVDKANGIYTVTAQIYISESGSAEPDASLANSAAVTGNGVTLSAALADAEINSGKKLFLGHVKSIIIGAGIEAPPDDLEYFLDYGVSPVCPVFYSDDPAAVAGTLFSEKIISAEQFTALSETASAQGKSVFCTLSELLENTGVLDCAAAVPVARAEKNTVIFDGLTFARKNGVAGIISPEDTIGAKILLGKFEKGDEIIVPITVENTLCAAVLNSVKTRLRAEITGGELKIYADVKLNITVAENPSKTEEIQIKKAVKENIRDACVSAYSSAVWYNFCDIYEIKKIVRRDCPDFFVEYCSAPEEYLSNSSLTVTVY